MTEHIYYRPRLYADGRGVSRQEHSIFLGPEPTPDGGCSDESKLVDTGIVYHWLIYSVPPRGETEEAQPYGPSDLLGVEECTYELAGRFYGNLDRALEAYHRSKT